MGLYGKSEDLNLYLSTLKIFRKKIALLIFFRNPWNCI